MASLHYIHSCPVVSRVLLILIACISFFTLKAEVKVIDAETFQPLPKASVFDKNGVLITVTEDDGKIPESITSFSYPLNIRYVGYEPLIVSSPDLDVAAMIVSSYTLPDIVIDEVSRNILYLQVYVREYTTLDNSKDTMAIFKEQVVDYAIPIGKAKYKGWKKPRVLGQKQYEYMKFDKKKSSLDTLLYSDGGKFRAKNFNISQKFKMPEIILSGDSTQYVDHGKYYPSERWSVVGDSYIYEIDELADYKDHYFSPGFLKLFGMSAAQTMDERKYRFEKTNKPGANVENLIEASENFDMIMKGKVFKKATEQNEDTKMNFFTEMFVTDRAYLTADEAKELKKDPPVVDIRNFKIPKGIPFPPEEVVRLKKLVLESIGE